MMGGGHTILPAIRRRPFTKSGDRIRAYIDTVYRDVRRAPRETKRRTAIPASDVEDRFAGTCSNRSGEQDGIKRNTVSPVGLQNFHPPAQQPVRCHSVS